MKKLLPFLFTITSLHYAVSQSIQLDIKVFLEGPFSTGQMNTDLNNSGFLPLTQPYGSSPWNYGGTETVSVIPNAEIVDWVLVDMVSVTLTDDTTKLYVLDRKACFLTKTGQITTLDGLSSPTFQYDGLTPFHVRVHHRNHLNMISSSALTENSGLFSWDFTTGSQKTLGGAHSQKELIADHWGMISSDGNASGQVNNADKNEVWFPVLGESGYLFGDFNMNGHVDTDDMLTQWMLNAGRGSFPVRDSIVVPPFTCGDTISDIDGNVYNTVLIGNQCWMKENLKVGTSISGSQNQTNNGIIEKYCYNNSTAYCNAFGGLYQWNEMMGYITTPGTQGICPSGWHIPTDDQWKILEGMVDSQYGVGHPIWDNTGLRGFDAGKYLKSTSGWSYGGNGTDLYGFGGLPGGIRNTDGSFFDYGNGGYWWSSSESSGADPWFRALVYNNYGSYRNLNYKTRGLSVRCLRDQLSTVISSPVTEITHNTAVSGGNVTDDGGVTVTARGVVWSKTTNPTIENNEGITSDGTGTGSFVSNLSGLIPLTDYFVRAYATNNAGTAYGDEMQFTTTFLCGTSAVEDFDGNSYNTVLIGTQCWMKENLKTTNYKNGTAIPNVTDGTTWQNLITGAYVWYNNDIAWKDSYGAIYNWYAVDNSDGLCPEGWHVPGNDEWIALTDHIGGTGSPNGNKLKSCRQVNSPLGGGCNTTLHPRWDSHSFYGTDDYGFSAFAGGKCLPNGGFIYLGGYGYWWIAEQHSSTNGLVRRLEYNSDAIYVQNYSKTHGFSVRCIKDELSTVITTEVTGITYNAAVGGGNVTDDGGATVTARGVVWSTTSNPTLENNEGITSDGTGTGSFVSNLSGLIPLTDYFVRAYATNSEGTAYGEEMQFTTAFLCGTNTVEDFDGNVYNTVLIGNQCWMKENLKVGTIINITQIQTDNGIIEKYCYSNSPAFCDSYGGLYRWDEMMEYSTTPGAQGICPPGWHIPTDNEWKILEFTVDSQYGVGDPIWNNIGVRGSDAGKNLKSTSGWYENGNGTDLYGFMALPGGICYSNGQSYYITHSGFWWSSNEYSGSNAWIRSLYYSSDGSGRSYDGKYNGVSVRCLKDTPPTQPPSQPSNPSPEDQSTNIEINTTLHWSCSDPDEDELCYNIYFGTDPNPALALASHPDTFYIPAILDYGTTYFWKIVAYDIQGESTEGNIWSFTTKSWNCGYQITDIDGNTYNTVLIGDQCWMKENLNVGTMIEGSQEQTNNGIIEKYCYNNSTANCNTYGGLYQWNEMMGYITIPGTQGICPPGWHIPTDSKWKILEGTVDSLYDVGDPIWDNTGWRGFDAGKNLKSTSEWSLGGNGTDLYDFGALPSGHRYSNGSFANLGDLVYWWTSTEYSDTHAYHRYLVYNRDESDRSYNIKTSGRSVRCLKNIPNQPPSQPSNPSPDDQSTNLEINTTFHWSCSDPDEDELYYNIYFGTDPNPALALTNHPDTFYMPGILDYETTYFWKIVAYDIHGDSTESNIWSFATKSWNCGCQITDIDGNMYNTVLIGTQCWMKENLKTTTYNNGTPIPNVTDDIAWSELTSGAYAWYGNDIGWKDSYGAIYNWYAVDNSDVLCPGGWHVPGNDEWTVLTNHIGGTGSPNGNKLKSCRQVNSPLGGDCNTTLHPRWDAHSFFGTDDYGFSAFAGGTRWPSGGFYHLGRNGYWWIAEQHSSTNGLTRLLKYDSDAISVPNYTKPHGFSVRCINDELLSTVITTEVTGITHNSAVSGGHVTDDGGVTVTARGVVWSTTTNPTIENNEGITSDGTGTGAFVSNLSGLNPSTVYFVRAYATNNAGTAYGEKMQFTTAFLCGTSTVEDFDGNSYNTVLIGNQCWMKENLNVGTMIDGSQDQTNNGIIEKYCYDNSTANCITYGGLYQWNELMGYSTSQGVQGICPPGWHIPTDDEWKTLEGTVDSQYGVGDPIWNNTGHRGFDAGKNLRSTSGWTWNGTDLYGFGVLPAGYRYTDGMFYFIGSNAISWSSTESSLTNAWNRLLLFFNDGVNRNSNDKTSGYSVRCLKD